MPKGRSAKAFHAESKNGSAHVVGITDLQVLIVQRDDSWFAQGIEIDYGVEGADLDDVRRTFEYGLAATIAANLRDFGSIKNLLHPAPQEIKNRFMAGAIKNRYSQISTHVFPFRIQFLEAA